MIKLQITEWERSEEFLIYKNSISVGSHSSNDLILVDKGLPKKILRLSVLSESEMLLDTQNFSELSLNGISLKGQAKLAIGDCLQMAQTEIKLIGFSLENPYIKSEADVERQLLDSHGKKPHLKKILDYLDKVGRDV